MKKIAIIYQSRYGFTERYAKWIAEETGGDLFPLRGLSPERLTGYDTLVFGGGLYAGKPGCASFVVKNYPQFEGKRLYFFTVGIAPTEDRSIFLKALDKHFPFDIRRAIRFYHLRGGLDYKALRPLHRMMMSVMRKSIASKPEAELTPADKDLLASVDHRVDYTDRESVLPLCRAVTAAGKEENSASSAGK